MFARRLRWLPALLVPAAVLWSVDAAGVNPGRAAAVAACAAAAAALLWALSRGVRLSLPSAWAGIFLAWAALSLAFQPVCSSTGFFFLAGGAVAVVLLLVTATERGRWWGGIALLAAGLTSACWLLVETAARGGRPAGPTGNPNLSAAVCLLALSALPAVLRQPRYRLGAGVVLLGGIAASQSRGALLAAGVLALVWAFQKGGRLRLLALAMGLAVVAAGGARLVVDRDPMRWERIRIWSVAVRTVQAEMPLGAGPGGFADAALRHNFPRTGEFARFHRLPSLAESDWLQVAATLGLPGLLILLALAWAVSRSAGPWTAGVVLAGAAASAVNTLLASPPVLWSAALALGVTLRRPDVSQPAQSRRVLGLPRVVKMDRVQAAACCILIAATCAGWLAGTGGEGAPDQLLARAGTLVRALPFDPHLADAEALAYSATQKRPRFAAAWQTLGHIRLARAEHNRDTSLLAGASAAFQQALSHDPNAVFALLGEVRVRRLASDETGAWRLLHRTVAIEPNFAGAWMELAALERQMARLESSCRAVARAAAAVEAGDRTAMVSEYERALVRLDRGALRRAAAVCGVP